LEFVVTVPGGFNTVTFNVPSLCDITDFFLRNDSRLVLNLDTDLTVLRTADIAGIIDAQGGHFTACGTSVAFTGNRARVYASDGSQVPICADNYSSTGLFRTELDNTFNWTLIDASGPLTEVNLSALESIDAGFTYAGDARRLVNHQHVNVRDGAKLDLSGVIVGTAGRRRSRRTDVLGGDAGSVGRLVRHDPFEEVTTCQVELRSADSSCSGLLPSR
jgi:hypothetical protein